MDPLSSTMPPGDILAGLASPRLDERDAATRLAILMGTAVSPKLLLWDEAPPSNRARRLWAYMGVHLRRAETYIRQPRNFELRHSGTLATALEVLAKRHGVLVARDLPAEAQRSVSLALADTTLLGAIDAAALQAGCHAGQRARGELAITAGAEPRYPAIYTGPLRVRVVELRGVRSTDFVTAQASVQARLRLDWEWPIAPLSPVFVKLDADDRSYEATHVATPVNVGIVSELVVECAPAPWLALTGIATAMFDGTYDDVRLPVPGSIEMHGLTATAEATAEGCQLVLETHDPIRARGEVSGLGLSPMILAIAGDEEGIPQVHRVRTVGGAPGSERWTLRNRDGFGTVTELRLRITAPPIRAAFPFALAPVQTP
ncbi:MAG: hypothetical protein ABI867_25885 [Kofleriaceae bacterium]